LQEAKRPSEIKSRRNQNGGQGNKPLPAACLDYSMIEATTPAPQPSAVYRTWAYFLSVGPFGVVASIIQ
jgi:hypothetical protein